MGIERLMQTCNLEREQAAQKIEKLQADITGFSVIAQIAEQGNAIIASAASNARTQVKEILEGLVNQALAEVFPDEEELTFSVNFEISYNKTSVKFELWQGGEVLDMLDSCGYGIADVVSFMLRIACIYLSGSRRLLVADEPFKFLDASRRPMLYQCLKDMSLQYGMEILMVSHDPLAMDFADRLYKVKKINRDSIAESIGG